MQKQTLLFNLDDTLVHCNKYFRDTINAFVAQLQEWFENLTKEEIKQKQLEIDLKSIEKYGLHSSRFPESLVATYLFFSEQNHQDIHEDRVERVKKIGQSVFEVPIEPLPNMYEVLDKLKEQGHDLYLHTGGDEENQGRKIVQLELAKYFEKRVFISEQKDTSALKEILNQIKYDPKKTWMIGNSLKTDIRPAIEAGIHAIHVPSELEWSYNQVKIDVAPKGKLLTVNSLVEVPEIIQKHAQETVVST
ncbi:HAD family hydrolase [Priestia megaterium]|uniref:HAD family hydrolase n=1 Tax=Priestia megaterium TaxID=1404 RepID=UPI000BF95C44|nr:HAD family hydrolase [Priestia megaterium]PFR96720.1 HAD family hydrolase [Priestia megaterium]